MDGEDDDDELRAAKSTHPGPSADPPGACDEAVAEVTVLRRLVSLKLVLPRM